MFCNRYFGADCKPWHTMRQSWKCKCKWSGEVRCVVFIWGANNIDKKAPEDIVKADKYNCYISPKL